MSFPVKTSKKPDQVGFSLFLTALPLIGLSTLPLHAISPSVSAGNEHSLFLNSAGLVWAAGSNWYGELGDRTNVDRRTPVLVQSDVQAISAGNGFSFFLKTDGSVWATGKNDYGQLGNGTRTNRSVPVQVLTGVQAIATGYFHSLFLKTDGSVWAVGRNDFGQLGDGTTTNRTLPVQTLAGVKALAAGASHSLMLKTDGSVWAAGRNLERQHGDGLSAAKSTPSLVRTGVKSITAGAFHSLFLQTDGTVMASGENRDGQLGYGNINSQTQAVPVLSRIQPSAVMDQVQAIAAGDYHSIFIKTDGSALATGSNSWGQLGDGRSNGRSLSGQVLNNVELAAGGYNHTLFLKSDGSVWATGANVTGKIVGGPIPGEKRLPTKIMHLTPTGIHPWQLQEFGTDAGNLAVSGWEMDPDLDGVVNLLERAFNLPPRQPGATELPLNGGTAGLPIVFLQQNQGGLVLGIQFIRRKGSADSDLNYTPQFSSIPSQNADWSPAAGNESVEPIDNFWERVSVLDTIHPFPSKRFARVKISTAE